jgi:hypothetical protein
MYYWNQDNFEGLRELAGALKADARLAGLARYCTLRERGLRREAFTALDRFLAETTRWEPQEARGRALAILELHLHSPRVHQFLSQPLRRRFLLPVLESWLEEGGAPAVAIRWLGVLRPDLSLVERALEMDPGDVVARRRLVTHHLRSAEFAMHHLDESRFIGSESETRDDLERAGTLLARAPGEQELSALAEEHSGLVRMLEDRLAFQATGAASFPDWCRARGREYSWPRKVYYGRAPGGGGAEADAEA